MHKRYPSSRRNPQFNRGTLERALSSHGVQYRFMGDGLGGHRAPIPNTDHGLDSEPMRGYAAHMRTAEFKTAVQHVCAAANTTAVALMCAERNPSDCHRSLISDYLSLCGFDVRHLVEAGHLLTHQCHPNAVIESGTIGYRHAQMDLGL